jgi:hypothetical protein
MQPTPDYLYAVPRLFRLTEPCNQPDGSPAYTDNNICVYVTEIGVIAACRTTLYRVNTARFEFSRVKCLDKAGQFYLCRYENVREYKPRHGNYQPPVRLMNDMNKRTAFVQSRRLNKLLLTASKLSLELKERSANRHEKEPLKDPYYTLFYGSLSRELCRLSNAGGSFMYNDLLYILCRTANKHYQYKVVCSETEFQQLIGLCEDDNYNELMKDAHLMTDDEFEQYKKLNPYAFKNLEKNSDFTPQDTDTHVINII